MLAGHTIFYAYGLCEGLGLKELYDDLFNKYPTYLKLNYNPSIRLLSAEKLHRRGCQHLHPVPENHQANCRQQKNPYHNVAEEWD
jgi:hypothetical protein